MWTYIGSAVLAILLFLCGACFAAVFASPAEDESGEDLL